jgi:NitT/TauT family transport system ATP-binding protein
MTALRNVELALKLRNRGEAKLKHSSKSVTGSLQSISEKAMYYLRKTGLAPFANKYPSQLSGGMRQRLALARALSVEPSILLMDEPFAAVDALTREKLQDELLRLLSEYNAEGRDSALTVVLVTHEVQEAVYLSDEVVIFSPSPGSIRNRIPIEVKRPRARTDPELLEIQDRIFSLFQYDINQEAEFSI